MHVDRSIVIRWPIWWLLDRLGRLAPMIHKAAAQMGLTGQGELNLTRFEAWLIGPWMEKEQHARRDCFRQACIDVLGEDPDDWGRTC